MLSIYHWRVMQYYAASHFCQSSITDITDAARCSQDCQAGQHIDVRNCCICSWALAISGNGKVDVDDGKTILSIFLLWFKFVAAWNLILAASGQWRVYVALWRCCATRSRASQNLCLRIYTNTYSIPRSFEPVSALFGPCVCAVLWLRQQHCVHSKFAAWSYNADLVAIIGKTISWL